MGGLTKQYVITRMFMWILTIWIGATAIFFIPRLAPGDPVTAMVMRMAEREGRVENAQELIAAWKERFGLDEPLYVQYVRYLGRLVRFDFGYSLARFPTTAGSWSNRRCRGRSVSWWWRPLFLLASGSPSARSWGGAKPPAGYRTSCRSA